MRKPGKRILAMFLCVVMCVSLLPTPALANTGTIEHASVGTISQAENDISASEDAEEMQEEENAPAEAVLVVFSVDPQSTEVTVYDGVKTDEESNPLKIELANEDGWLLLPGKYLYDAVCEGYSSVEKAEFEVREDEGKELNIEVVLTMLSDEEAEKDATENAAEPELSALPETEALPKSTEDQQAEEFNETVTLDGQKDAAESEAESEEPQINRNADSEDGTSLFDPNRNEITGIPAEDGSGTLDISVRYGLDEDTYQALEGLTLTISWTGEASLLEESLTMTAEDAGTLEVDSEHKHIYWTIGCAEGEASFRLETVKSCKVYLDAVFSYSVDGEDKEFAFTGAEFLAAHYYALFSYDNAESIAVSGFAPADSEIQLYLDNTYVSSVFAAENGSFSGTITVPGWEEDAIHCVQSRCLVNGQTYWKSASFYRKAPQPELIGMKYYDSADATEYIDLYAASQSGSTVAIDYTGNNEPFIIVLEFSHAERIESAYVTATIDGKNYSLEAQYQAELDAFVAEGYFVEGDKRLSPDSIRADYIPVGTTRTVSEEIDVSEGSDIYSLVTNDFPNAAASIDESSTTTEFSVYHIDLEYDGTEEELANKAIEYSVKVMDYVTGKELFDSYEAYTNVLKYIVPGLDEDRYYLNLDLSDPDSIRILVVDAADAINWAAEYTISCLDTTFDTIGEQKKYVKWADIADKIGTVTTIMDVIGDSYDIIKDTKELEEEIRNSEYLTDEQKEIALQKTNELNGDRLAFTLLITILPMIVETGGAAAPIAAFTAMLWAMETLSDTLYETRAARIKTPSIDVDWGKNTGKLAIVEEDGLTYQVSYYLTKQSDIYYDMWGYPHDEYILTPYYDIQVSGSGESDGRHVKRKATDQIRAAYGNETDTGTRVEVSSGVLRNITYNDGITGIKNAIDGTPGYPSHYTHVSVAASVTSFPSGFLNYYSYTAGTIGSESDFEFGWTVIPDNCFSNSQVESLTIAGGVTHIGEDAFCNCDSLTTVTIGQGLESIEESAFSGCNVLTKVMLPQSLNRIGKSAFFGCSSLSSLSLPSGTLELYCDAFQNCSSLEEIIIPSDLTVVQTPSFSSQSPFHGSGLRHVEFMDGTKTVNSYLFYQCESLCDVVFPDGLTEIKNDAFCGTGLTEIEIPDSVTAIRQYAFLCCSSLKSVKLPVNDRCLLEGGAFYGCSALTGIDIPKGVVGYIFDNFDYLDYLYQDKVNYYDQNQAMGPFTESGVTEVCIEEGMQTIPFSLLSGCENLQRVEIPDTVTCIEPCAFYNCVSLEEVKLPEKDCVLHFFAFKGCTALKDIFIPKNLRVDSRITNSGFPFCKSGLEQISFEAGLQRIPKGMFGECEDLQQVTIPAGVESIGERAFYGCVSLTSIMIPDSVTAIENGAFNSCTSLISITIPTSVTSIGESAFSYSGLTSATIPASVTSIESYCFSGCSSLVSVTIPTSVTSIGDSAFAYSGLTSVTIPASVTSIGESAFAGCDSLSSLTIPASVTIVGEHAFGGLGLEEIYFQGEAPDGYNCFYYNTTATAYYPAGDSSWTYNKKDDLDGYGTITWQLYLMEPVSGSCGNPSNSLTWILNSKGTLTISGTGKMADFGYGSSPWFSNRELVRTVILEEGVKNIGSYAFYNCSSLTSVTIPEGVTSIGEDAFSFCSSLTSLTIPASVASIDGSAFDYTGLEEFIVAPGNQYYTAVDKVLFNKDLSKLVRCPEGINDVVEIPASVITIGESAFRNCAQLTSLTIPEGVASIGDWTFASCESLTDIKLPESLTRIGEYAFAYCDSLTGITISKNVTDIGEDAFEGCDSLAEFRVANDNPVYSSANGALLNKDKTTLLCCPGGRSGMYSIPNGVININRYAFAYCEKLTGVLIPKSVTSIGYAAFSSCRGLLSITIPASVTEISSYAFYQCYDLSEIYFEGSAPKIAGYSFYTVYATAYYPADDETWTEEVMQDYGGSITWMAKTQETPSNITSSSVDFNGKLFLNTYIKLSDEIMADEDAYIRMMFNDVTTDHSVAELIRNLDSQGRVKVKQEMYAAMLRDEITLQVLDGQGRVQPLTYKEMTDVTDGFVFTALEYLKGRQENSTNPYMVELAKAAELYGIAVQVKFGYNTDLLTEEDIAMMEAAAADITIPASCDEEVTGTLPAGVTKQTKTVMFESDNTLRLYYYFDDASFGNYTFTLDGETVTAAKKEAGKYYVEQKNIASGLLSSRYTFTVSDGTDTYTINTSALAYAYGRQENSSDQLMIDLSKLLYRYSQAADAYFGS